MTSSTPAPSQRIAIVAPSAHAAWRLRGGFVRALVKHRHRVTCLVPDATAEDRSRIAALGAECRDYELRSKGLSLFAVSRAVDALALLLKDIDPHTVLAAGGDAMTLGALAGKEAGVARIVSLCTGLPPDDPWLAEDALSPRRVRSGLANSHTIVCHNGDDARRLATLRLVEPARPITVVPGAGVDLEHHAMQPLPPLGPGIVFLTLARLEKSRGIPELLKAATELKPRAPGARFLLAGLPGRGGDAISSREIERSGGVEFLGALDDVRPALGGAHVFVYPSHGEGMPLAVLEALAAGRPVITTRTPGCRETVDEHVNGWLVPPGEPRQLAQAMESYLKRPDLIPAAARASRAKAERLFDQNGVNTTMMAVLGTG